MNKWLFVYFFWSQSAAGQDTVASASDTHFVHQCLSLQANVHASRNIDIQTYIHTHMQSGAIHCVFRPWNKVVCFCVALLNRYWGIVMYGAGASSWASQGRRTHDLRSPTSQPYPVPPLITWGVRILTLHLNYVACYTDPLLSSSNGPTTTTLTTKGLCPGGSVVWASPKFVRPHRWGYWVMIRFLEIQGPNCREILHRPLPKATHVC